MCATASSSIWSWLEMEMELESELELKLAVMWVAGSCAARLVLGVALLLVLAHHVQGRAYMRSPAARNVVALGAYKTPWELDAFDGGGPDVDQASGHGLCGGLLDDPTKTMLESGDWVSDVQTTYLAGGVLTAEIVVTEHRGGHLEMRLCELDEEANVTTQDCLNEHVLEYELTAVVTSYSDDMPYNLSSPADYSALPDELQCENIADRGPRGLCCRQGGKCSPESSNVDRWVLPEANTLGPDGASLYSIAFRLPANVTCAHCVLQMAIVDAPATAGEFPSATYNCADVAIEADEQETLSGLSTVASGAIAGSGGFLVLASLATLVWMRRRSYNEEDTESRFFGRSFTFTTGTNSIPAFGKLASSNGPSLVGRIVVSIAAWHHARSGNFESGPWHNDGPSHDSWVFITIATRPHARSGDSSERSTSIDPEREHCQPDEQELSKGTVESGHGRSSRRQRRTKYVKLEDEDPQVRLALSMLPSVPGDVTDNMAFQTLSSWPVLPLYKRFVESTLLVPIGTDNRVVLIFDYDVLDGAKGLSFASYMNQEMQARLDPELEKLRVHLKSRLGSKSLAEALAEAGVEVRLGGAGFRWFAIVANNDDSRAIIRHWKRQEAGCESKTLGKLVLLTASDGSSLARLFLDAPLGTFGSPKLLLGHMAWTSGQLEQEVLFGRWWPCEYVEAYALSSNFEGSSLYSLFTQTPKVPMNGHYYLDTCRIGYREAQAEHIRAQQTNFYDEDDKD
ncbi:Hypothetical Protein FCC1311_088532 [Hondaea fermentalgiana]|uniref:Chitin-binding type-4 domain-containing protein n=1 Tax=Hondaea fermentalgiana TaxID=2315210 RepID=A0A2R5GS93_9STRA|nr:Hypothetical Protein FCC1311_088532 [Hondaea fermentalgiana]|eukprot:GBG32628.1 Hypothetical Protein FCC1311_088532 [Hondaea fermentalgiana]